MFKKIETKIEYLSAYSSDLNFIEIFFNSLKAWLKRNYILAEKYKDNYTELLYLDIETII
jgi:transposase